MRKIILLAGLFCIFTSLAPKRQLTWMAIGDSITYGNEHPEDSDNRAKKGYLTRVTEKLPHIHYTNHGHNGWTSARMAGAIETLGIEKADIYSVFLGTNDWWSGLALGTLADYQNNTGNKTLNGSFRTIINKIRSLNKDAKIILITPMPRVDFVYIKNYKNNAYGSYKEKNGHTLAQFADAINAIGKAENFKVVDLYYKSGMTHSNLVKYKRLKDPQTGVYKNYPYPDFINIPFNPQTDEYPYPVDAIDMTYDGLHPSDKGLGVIANMMVKVMKKYK